MSRSAKGQAMIEYFIYFSVSFVIFTGLFISMFVFETSEVSDIRYTELNEYGIEIQTMFFVFAQMNPVFTQTVTLQEQINNKGYNFSILASNLYLTQEEIEIILPLPIINGNITNKTFQVRVTSDEVFVS